MQIRNTLMTGLAVMALATAGCRGSSSNDTDGGNHGDGGDGDNTIQEVQSADMAIGTAVTLRGVVVTAIDNYGGRVGGVYVEEPEGGAYSGVFIYVSGSDAAGLAVGDLVDVTGGAKDEFTLETDACERTSDCTVTEISASSGSISITKVGTGTVPDPELLDPWDLAADDTEAEKWEGVLIEFDDVAVTTAKHGISGTDPTLEQMTVTGPFRVESSLVALPDVARDYCFQSIVGIGDYFFDYYMIPRSSADFGAEGSNCLAQEEGETACTDEEDNDHDGFTDCEDFSCQQTWADCVTDATVVEVQSDTYPLNSAVNLTGVVVTAIDKNRYSFWVQDEGDTSQNNGLYIYRGNNSHPPADGELAAGIVVGEKVDISGTVDDYYGETQLNITDGSVTDTSSTATVVLIPGADITTLSTLASGAPWEGALVQFTDVPVLTDPDQYGEVTVGVSGTPLYVDDTLYSYGDTLASGGCLATLTGIVIMDTYDTPIPVHYYLAPRSADDIVTGGTCD